MVHTRIFGCTTQLRYPSLIECNEILISKQEIATPAIARHYKHLHDIEQFIPELDRNAEVMLLIGRYVTAGHHILDQRIGKENEPYAQRLCLGWAIIGETCLGLVHTSDTITVNKTTVLPHGRETNLKPCEYGFRVKDKEPDIGSTVFKQTREDDTLRLSQEDKEFLIVMDNEFHTSENGRLSAPLPFRRDRLKLQNNYHQARQRAENLSRSFKRDPTKQQHFVEFMKNIFVNNHAETATPAREAVANYGLRKAVSDHTYLDTCDDVCHYVNNNFYVDDGLVSGDSPEEIVILIKKTQERLITGGKIRLHKIVSSSSEVVKSFETNGLAESITEIDFNSESTCLQRSLGLCWNVVKDSFTYQLSKEEKSFTKGGLLSVIYGIFDPLGFIAPVILGGRLIMREAVQNSSLDWDDPLPNNLLSDWQRWKQSLQDLETLEIGRPFTSQSLNDSTTEGESHIFSDASKEAISSVAYIRTFDKNGNSQLGFLVGKSKLAPCHGHTIPRLELCGAVLSTELTTFIQNEPKLPLSSTHFYTDGQVVLGYIYNEKRRFYVYVSYRVSKILKGSVTSQWSYVPTELNPSDHRTRP
ncbi:uncharacterized protein [Mytilus edulis]|uniref:uncharacterized protein n=1 Tax=Mytilus edulis TaxID=6550 RepID=UPI0039F08E28